MTTAAPLKHPETYFARNGEIWSSDGRRLSIPAARELRRFFLDDMAQVEETHGETDPATADALLARDLRLAGELRVAIRTALVFEPEPRVDLPMVSA